MIHISGYAKRYTDKIPESFQAKTTISEDRTDTLLINSCGQLICKTKDYIQEQKNSRNEYKILYIHKGCGHFLSEEEWKMISAGNILLFSPFEPQICSYYAEESPEVFWISFTGTPAQRVLQDFSIQNGYIGKNQLLKQHFQSIIAELQLKKPRYQELSISHFYSMLSLISRLQTSAQQPLECDFALDRLILKLHQSYGEPWTISSMAACCQLSESYFAHAFLRRTGTSPMKYLNRLRIETAKELLYAKNMSISQVSSMSGFRDSLYFSKLFRKSTGMSPTKFRQSL